MPGKSITTQTASARYIFSKVGNKKNFFRIHKAKAKTQCIYINMYIYMYSASGRYGVASISRMLKNIGLFCKRALQKRPIFLKETYIFKHSINRSHPILLTTINEYFLLLFTNILLLTNMALTFSQKNAIALFFFFC